MEWMHRENKSLKMNLWITKEHKYKSNYDKLYENCNFVIGIIKNVFGIRENPNKTTEEKNNTLLSHMLQKYSISNI